MKPTDIIDSPVNQLASSINLGLAMAGTFFICFVIYYAFIMGR